MGLFDVQLLVQTILYFAAFVLGFVVSIPIGVTSIKFNGACMLYGDFQWANATHFTMYSSNHTNCNFPIYLSVFACIFYGLGMGIYNFYALYKSKADPTIGSQMWVMPFILSNSLVAAAVFISSCIISVGFSKFCSGILNGDLYKNCADGQNHNWRSITDGKLFNVGNYYSFLTVAQTASWICFLVWTVQVVFGVIRFIRNRKIRSRNEGGQIQTPDTKKFGNADLTA